jgi:hypothetical protein
MTDAQTSTMTDFVLLLADWPATQGLGVLEADSTGAVVVERRRTAPGAAGEPAVAYYLLVLSQAIRVLGDAPAGASIGQALDRAQTPTVPAHEGIDPAAGGPYVVLEEGRVVGFSNLRPLRSLTFDGGRRRGIDAIAVDDGAPAPEMAAGAGEPEAAVVERSLQAAFPEAVPLNQTATLTLELTVAAPTGPALPVRQAAGTVLDILVQARKGFAVEGRA